MNDLTVPNLKHRVQDLLDGKEELVDRWFKSDNSELGGATPQSFLDQGRLRAVETLIYMIETGQPG